MEFFKKTTNIDFMAQRKWAIAFSICLFIFSTFSLIFKGLNLGLDFTGGTQFQISYETSVNFDAIRQELNSIGFKDAVIQAYGSSKDVAIRLKADNSITQQELTKKVLSALKGAKLEQVEFIGPEVGKTLVVNGMLAVLVSILATMIYIALRFEYRFAVSAAISLIHDPVLILGLFSFFGIEFNLISLAALLTMLGYSLNDTIVIYDRMRENFRRVRNAKPLEIMNISVNQTLSRTIMTSGLTLMVVVILFFFGGQTLHGFALALIIGIIIGTYSSIYIAGSIAIMMGLNRTHISSGQKRIIDNAP